jgi:hypothetical protein
MEEGKMADVAWEMVLEPGESTGVYTHEHDYLIHVIEGSTLTAADENGAGAVNFDFETAPTTT